MKRGEIFSQNRIAPGSYIIIRVDGRNFHKYTSATRVARPFDENFNRRMVKVGYEVMGEFNGLYAQTHSDECSVLLSADSEIFDRRHEKIVSVGASVATSAFAEADCDRAFEVEMDAPTFDAHLSIWSREEDVIDYFHWRYVDSWINCVSAYAYWTLRHNGDTKREAHRKTQIDHHEKHDLLHTFGINAAKLPPWQKNGTALCWEYYEKKGWNPITQEIVFADRRRIVDQQIEATQEDTFKAQVALSIAEGALKRG